MRMGPHGVISVAVVVALLACLQAPAAQAYPERTITLIVPFAPGGPTDIIARILAESLSQSLKQSVIVDNRPGAAGNVGMGAAARAQPDGYTLLLTSTAIAVNPALFKKLPYDPFKDFMPISELVDAPNIIVVRADSGMNTLADLIARAKAAPGTFNYSSPGIGTKSNLTGEELKQRAGIEMTHIPYRGAGPAAVAVLEGTVQVGSVALPAEIVAMLAQSCREAFASEKARQTAHAAGFEIVAGTPDQLAARLASEIPAVKALVARTGLKLQ